MSKASYEQPPVGLMDHEPGFSKVRIPNSGDIEGDATLIDTYRANGFGFAGKDELGAVIMKCTADNVRALEKKQHDDHNARRNAIMTSVPDGLIGAKNESKVNTDPRTPESFFNGSADIGADL